LQAKFRVNLPWRCVHGVYNYTLSFQELDNKNLLFRSVFISSNKMLKQA